MFLATVLSLVTLAAPDAPLYEAEFLFPPEPFHNHSSSCCSCCRMATGSAR